jgi:hypothetical protein
MTKKQRIHLDASALSSCILAKAHNKLQRKMEINFFIILKMRKRKIRR